MRLTLAIPAQIDTGTGQKRPARRCSRPSGKSRPAGADCDDAVQYLRHLPLRSRVEFGTSPARRRPAAWSVMMIFRRQGVSS